MTASADAWHSAPMDGRRAAWVALALSAAASCAREPPPPSPYGAGFPFAPASAPAAVAAVEIPDADTGAPAPEEADEASDGGAMFGVLTSVDGGAFDGVTSFDADAAAIAAFSAPFDAAGVGLGMPSGLSPGTIQRVVNARLSQIRACYLHALPRSPGLRGGVRVRLEIAADGSVASATDAGSTMPDPTVTTCVLDVFRQLRFPPPQSAPVSVTYPITFVPGD